MTLKVACWCGMKAFPTEEAARLHCARIEARGVSDELPTDVRECPQGMWHLVYDRAPVRLNARSAKQQEVYNERAPLVARMLADHPVCERCRRARSTEVHEPRMRSRGVDICDPAECVALCSLCHREVHDRPARATADGWLIPSGDKATPARAAAERAALAAWTAREAS